jgi:site-specific DNA-methyltransferase (adenine-specific)
MKYKSMIKITNKELIQELIGEIKDFPRYTTQLINLANQNAQGTRPRVVGQLSELINECPEKTYEGWKNWYLKKHPTAVKNATEKIDEMVNNLKGAINLIDKSMTTKHKIIIGDSRNMDEIKNESVHLIVTSPPYWQIKDYGDRNQIGFNDTYEEYIDNLNRVWSECYRVLLPGCRLCVNIGDQFARAVTYGRYKIIPIREEIIRFCESIGFDYMGAIIWQKKTTMNTTGGASVMGSFPYPRNGLIEIDYEFILLLKKLGKFPNDILSSIKEQSKLSNEEWRKYFTGHWNFAGEKQNGHIAMFPEELPRRLIKMFSFAGETILDPFLGSGTTAKVAGEIKRNSIGYEINEEYLPIIKQKIEIGKKPLFKKKCDFEIIFQQIKKKSETKKYFSKPIIKKAIINNRINNPEYWKELKIRTCP